MVYLREQHRLIRNDLRTGEFQGAYWCWFTATSHNTWFFLSEELRAGLDDGTDMRRIRCMEVIPFGMKQKGRPYRARVLKFSLWGVQRAVSKFNDQPDSWSHSGSSYQILRRLVPCRPHDRLNHENLLEIRPFLTLAITTATEHFLVINYQKLFASLRTQNQSLYARVSMIFRLLLLRCKVWCFCSLKSSDCDRHKG